MAITDRGPAALALAHALFAAERGLPVIPLSPTKLPALPSPHRHDIEPVRCRGECGLTGHGVHDATTDPAGVRALFAAAPWATGYGIACGRPPHHLIGIDLDVKPPPAHPNDPAPSGQANGPSASPNCPTVDPHRLPNRSNEANEAKGVDEVKEAPADSLSSLHYLALRHLFTIPETITVLTPSGGRHLWLTGPPDVVVPNSVGRLAPGIDVRGAGGYLVGPGSCSHQGLYRLAPGTAELSPAKCPRALLRLVAPPARAQQTAPTPSGTRPQHGQGLVQFVRAAHEGQRNTRLFWAACRAYENRIGTTLANALTKAAVQAGLTEREARATIASAARLTSSPTR
ncbi:bifunctional DNA primase/polymerase [Streptomyces albipurpureus]|uniref:Bifunctional DNA primase/polymerase n=1 Tax=Streptomyces albipurpureus TaxID=2897419 RepID=A0ABT0US27_9ACTN|nr:bifunctional DNA primase/polymerase [Streptomyces sp. CWNU-1]MCM2391407.1 bifunctional DNA primase/polymerase [Streptomyces sp. CWNU-1]